MLRLAMQKLLPNLDLTARKCGIELQLIGQQLIRLQLIRARLQSQMTFADRSLSLSNQGSKLRYVHLRHTVLFINALTVH
jgi:hypothetical protein